MVMKTHIGKEHGEKDWLKHLKMNRNDLEEVDNIGTELT